MNGNINPIINNISLDDINKFEKIVKNNLDKINNRDHNGYSPLHFAFIIGNITKIKLLIKYGAIKSIFKRDLNNNFPLHYIDKFNKKQLKGIIPILTMVIDKLGNTILHYLIYFKEKKILGKFTIVANTINLDKANKKGITPKMMFLTTFKWCKKRKKKNDCKKLYKINYRD